MEASSPEALAASASIDNVSVVEENDYELIWQDEFSGDRLNQENWDMNWEVFAGMSSSTTDSTENVYLDNGNLVLNVTERYGEDRYANPRGGTSARQVIYDSGSVRTVGKQDFYMVVSKLGPSFPRVREPFQPFGHWG
ncbi:hypothetical protein [Streptococcus equi]|uniref:hypothetical protein n=1 Tax=Streptococcus equi TaxID=1336 RepID=UPI0032D90C19